MGSVEDEDEEPGFIVSDGHLSVSEYNFSCDEASNDEEKIREMSLRKERFKTSNN